MGENAIVCSRHSGLPDHLFGKTFMQADRQYKGITEHIGNPVGIQKGGDYRLPQEAVHSLCNVEDQITGLPCSKKAHQGLHVADPHRLMAKFLQSRIDGIDGDNAVALGNQFRCVPFFEVIILQIIGHSDQHVAFSLAVG